MEILVLLLQNLASCLRRVTMQHTSGQTDYVWGIAKQGYSHGSCASTLLVGPHVSWIRRVFNDYLIMQQSLQVCLHLRAQTSREENLRPYGVVCRRLAGASAPSLCSRFLVERS